MILTIINDLGMIAVLPVQSCNIGLFSRLKISKSASSHILKVKNRARDPRTRYDSHTDGGYTTDEKEIYKGVYGKTLK